ncbi:hypothetical protein [Labedaea rhizosphaerae]|uniref:Uncharacterized protein n=1 Tax=Labedaea rhizosphaerae TaxID=598644 RepID=A0A4R6SDD5_LABRH|nr:hypothetical protein [Labedaea rhizosphaerae]TDP97116.1 hypothetical protein EV186_10376 [Labedaea rhizosphaerae]
MTTPNPVEHRRPRLLVLVVLAWVAAAALAVGGSFAPLFIESERPSSSSSQDDGSSFELTAWDHTSTNHGKEVDQEGVGTAFGLPITVAAAVLFAGALIGIGALLTGSDPGLRWSSGVAGAGSAVLLGSVGTVAMQAKALSDEFAHVTTTVGRSDYYDVQAGIGNGLWMMLFGAVLGVVAVAVGLIARNRLGPDWLRPAEPEQIEDDAPATPSFGVPVIRPIGYD